MIVGVKNEEREDVAEAKPEVENKKTRSDTSLRCQALARQVPGLKTPE